MVPAKARFDPGTGLSGYAAACLAFSPLFSLPFCLRISPIILRCFCALTVLVALGGGVVLGGEPPKPGVVFVVGGIGGLDPLQATAPLALPLAGVPHEIRVFEWTHGKARLLRDLQDTRYLLCQGARLAEQVREVLREDPDRPIYLMGHSAGAGVVLAAAEHLPPQSLERIILLSAAVSPGFDLRPALRATRHEIVSFHSRRDRLVLHVGTSLFGTVDRVYGPSAGVAGFTPPDDLDAEGLRMYERVVQVPWRFDMTLECVGAGGHHATCMPLFLARRVAPWLLP
jgi:pimeloyl-ACP methyl ester carboxylesterase